MQPSGMTEWLGVACLSLFLLWVITRAVPKFLYVYKRNQAISRELPRAEGLPWLWGGRALFIIRQLLRGQAGLIAISEETLELCERLGPIYVGFVGWVPFVGVQGGEEVRQVCSASDGVTYRKNFGYELSRPLLGDSLLIASGPFWKRHRKIMDAGFSMKMLQPAIDIVDQLIQTRLASWRDQATKQQDSSSVLALDPFQEMLSLTADTIGLYTFSEPFEGSLSRSFGIILAMLGWRIWQNSLLPFWQYMPTVGNLRYWYHLHHLKSRISQLITQRLAMSSAQRQAYRDVLSLMITEDENHIPQLAMERQQLRDECVGLVFAGHDTTASTLAWTFYLLAQHPDMQERVRTELLQELGTDESPNLAQLEKLKYTSAVIKEVLRMYPPAAIGRTSLVPTRIGSYNLPAGSEIFINIYAMHRSARYWEKPHEFNPERFLRPLSEKESASYLPFGGAPRSCIGMRLAQIEMKIILWRTLTQASLECVPGARKPAMLPSLTLHPVHIQCAVRFSSTQESRD